MPGTIRNTRKKRHLKIILILRHLLVCVVGIIKLEKKRDLQKQRFPCQEKIYTIEIYIAKTIKVLDLWESMKLYKAD